MNEKGNLIIRLEQRAQSYHRRYMSSDDRIESEIYYALETLVLNLIEDIRDL